MSRDNRIAKSTIVLLVILIISILFVISWIVYTIISDVNNKRSIVYSGTDDESIIEWVAAPKQEDIIQPEGFGVEREITNNVENNYSLSDIKSSNESSSRTSILLASDDEDVKEAVEQLVEVSDVGKYRCMIDWSDYDVSSSDYYVLLSLVGKMYEDELNVGGSDTYTVISRQPTNEQLEEAQIPVLFDIDNEGYLTIYSDMIIRNKTSNTEVEEIKALTIYYEGDILTFRR